MFDRTPQPSIHYSFAQILGHAESSAFSSIPGEVVRYVQHVRTAGQSQRDKIFDPGELLWITGGAGGRKSNDFPVDRILTNGKMDGIRRFV
jgi:hypothetical protein